VIKLFQKVFDHLQDRFSIYFQYVRKHWKSLLVTVTLGVLAIVIFLGWLSAKKVRDTVVENFNQQQLVLARHAASQTEIFFDIIKREMSLLSKHPALTSSDPALLEKLLPVSFSLFADEGLLEIRYFDAVSKHVYRAVPQGKEFRIEQPTSRDRELFSSSLKSSNQDRLHFHVFIEHGPAADTGKHTALLYLAKDVYTPENSSMRGMLICVVDGLVVAERRLKDIRSGRTGYAWLIDNNGFFLYHPVADFIGKDAFEARRERGPSISFTQIDSIQNEKMLKGEEGTGAYISGWHRGMHGTIKKLIAYSPVRISATPEPMTWSVAVVAPMTEVEGAIADIQFRQNLLEGSIIIFVLIASFITFTVLAQWSTALEEEVHKKADALLQSENQYTSLVEHASDIIYTVDHGGKFLTVNKAGTDFFKKTRAEIIQSDIGRICFNEESASRQYKAINDVFETGESREIVYPININNSEIWVSTSYSLVGGSTGTVPTVLGISRDVTQRKRSEERMYHTEKLASLGTLAAGVAHEINNPLAVILGFTDMLLEKTGADPDMQEMLKTIEKQGNNAKRVVENLLSFARYREGKETLFDVNESIEDVLQVAGNTLKVSKVTVEKEFGKDLPSFRGDAREIEQVILNIVNNAVHAMKGSGVLTIKTCLSGSGKAVEIRLSDTGTGIRKEHRGKIFDPLFTTKEVGQGTGLGLSVCYAIVSKYGGTITFETRSEEDGPPTGTTFIVDLPIATKERTQSAPIAT